ncbi:hypothetical protein DACRYDRAFT_17203 [Dacryopinax primogenitus]|uniref:Beta-lactamase-related domain-containing protein n=1 Tax=Dacryopinax primogenitus (strain DJM 731) TaxID=1858805 RepID=M5G0Z9_DACPD|nr:uncharacterized protein DACRYDRAFT_17203 [Dacryopinax primogenitus]EJT99501.1 hypothetical protein DACRYDRAFT_17203 [Dacryopinax primogenitus]
MSQELKSKLDALLQESAAKGASGIPGVALVVLQREGNVYEGHAGVDDFDTGRPFTEDTVVWIASMTKAMTSVAALQCVERSLIGLEDDVSPLVPELQDVQLIDRTAENLEEGEYVLNPAKEKVTLRRLLTHSSGLIYGHAYPHGVKYMLKHDIPGVKAASKAVFAFPSWHEAGKEWHYGMKEIRGPLGMDSTVFNLTPELVQRKASMYEREKSGDVKKREDEWPERVQVDMGGGGSWSTTRDYAKFVRMLLLGGRTPDGKEILKPETWEMGMKGQLEPEAKKSCNEFHSLGGTSLSKFPGAKRDYGLIGMVFEEPLVTGRATGSVQWAGVANCYWLVDAKKDIGILPSSDPTPHRQLRSILRPPPPPPKNVFTTLTTNFLSIPARFGLPTQSQSPAPATQIPTPTANPPAIAQQPPQTAKKPLKQAHFRMPVLSVTYSISSSQPPCSPETSKSRVQAEEALRETLVTLRESVWSPERVEGFYRDCCRTREERPDEKIILAIKVANDESQHGLSNKPRVLDLTGITLSVFHAAAVADVLALNLRLSKVILDGCDLDEQSLKPLLHALLISAALPALSLANNPRLKPPALSLLQTYLSRTRKLSSLDLSGIPLPPASAQILVQVLAKPEDVNDGSQTPLSPNMKGKGVRKEDWEVARLLLSEPWHEEGEDDGDGLITLRLDNCSLKPASLEVLAHAIRPSQLCHLSLRQNRISASGAVALAVLMKDYPDTSFQPIVMPPSFPPSQSYSSLSSYATPPPPPRLLPPRPPTAPAASGTPQPSQGPSSGTAPAAPPTTYAAYVPKVKRIQQQQALLIAQGRPLPHIHQVPPLPPSLQNTPRSTPAASPRASVTSLPLTSSLSPGNSLHSHLPPLSTGTPVRRSPPILASSDGGGITMRQVQTRDGDKPTNGGGGGLPSPALLSHVRGLDEVPRLGKLRTVDLKGNDIRTGVTYIAQVLKRNRTLRVLNLAENRIDEKGLSSIAEALKYNETLETLDMSGNPCCGPSLEGVTSLRMAFTVNRSLKRLFLSNTNLTSTAAIHLAEFIPESSTLLHLDLTRNDLDYAGILALAAGMRSNMTLRCLDLSIPPNNEQAARCSRDILQACIRNTEKAGRGSELLGKSAILHALQGSDPELPTATKPPKDESEARPLKANEKERLKVVRLSEIEVVDCVGEICRGERDVGADARQALLERLEEMARAERVEGRLSQLLELMDGLEASAKMPAKARQKAVNGDARLGLGLGLNGLSIASPSGSGSGSSPGEGSGSGTHTPVQSPGGSQTLSTSPSIAHALSPAFSITSGSDDEASDEEPLGAGVDPDAEELGRDIRPRLSVGVSFEGAGEAHNASRSSPVVTSPASGSRLPPHSPVEERSKYWVEEEGEVFRRGHALLTEDEMEEKDVDGDELRKELLEKEVKRPPPRTVPLEDETTSPREEVPTLSFFPDQVRP